MRYILTGALLLTLSLGATAPQPAAAELAAASSGFTFKRIKAPARGSRPVVDVQIAPRDRPAVPPLPEPVEVAAALPAAAGRPAAAGAHGWFWDAVSPAITDTAPGRLASALRRLANAPSGQLTTPRLDTLLKIAGAHGADILRVTAGTRVSPALVLAMIAVESAGRADAVSHAGAEGLMQLMPATASRFGVTDRRNPADNIKGGVAFLNLLMQQFGGDPILVLAGYNAGENAVVRHAGVPPYEETRDYVPKVLAAFDLARSLCLSRPELISDGCVFRIPS